MDFWQILDMVQGSTVSFLYYAAVFVVVLSILVFVHEWGHYIIARLCGVRVKTFSIGFGREIFGIDDSHGTRWKFSLIPLGGYVQLFGDTDPASTGHTDMIEDEELGEMRKMTEKEKHEAFFAKPVWKRAAVVFAGPAINYLFAIVLLAGLYTFNGQAITPPVVAAVGADSAAEEANFQPHDRIVEIDGKRIVDFEDVRREMMISLDVERRFVVERDGEKLNIQATPTREEQEDHFGFKHSRGVLGVVSPAHGLALEGIVSVDGQSLADVEAVRQALLSRMDTTFEIAVKKGESDTQTYIVHPMSQYNESINEASEDGFNVLYLANIEANQFVTYPPHVALYEAAEETVIITRGIVEALGQIITGLRSPTELGGVIRIGAVAGDMAQKGIVALILLTAMLSVNLGFINLLPIPVLDGGHLLFYAFEAALGRPIPYKVQEYAFNFGLIFLVAIMAFTNLNDVVQLFS